MKERIKIWAVGLVVIGLAVSLAWPGSSPAAGKSRSGNNIGAVVSSLPVEALSATETKGLLYLVEEEKLARDVYIALYDRWKLPIFSNIASSEQQHMDALRALLKKYDLADPTAGTAKGAFQDARLQKLYHDLVKKGGASLAAALETGATIEDLDIHDLQQQLKETDNQDVTIVYQNLMKGSRNHLRSFNRQIQAQGGSYRARYITAATLSEILSTPQERGVFNQGGQTAPGGAGRGQGRMNRGGSNR